MTSPSARVRSVALPTEHGGWGFTLEPILLGLLVAPSAAGWEIAAAALGVFLARRPVKLFSTDVIRGRWLPRSTTALAVAAVYGVVAIAGAAGAITTTRGPFWWPLLVAVPFAAFALRADAHSHNRALAPQLAGSIAMGSTVAAIAMGAGWEWIPAFGLWLILAARDIAAIVLARGMVRRFKDKSVDRTRIYIVQVAAVGVVAAGAAAGVVPWLGVVAIGLLGIIAVVSLTRPPVPAKVVGWTQMGVGLMVALLTAIGVWVGW
ncbi:MAG: YwiC-like family protein [Actinobacteria bacterium]|nr:YwiC-like family protein [Actinomycetota bacterium]